jgi:type I site-specific restriction-modification system R (restriction) subunit
MLKYPHLSEQKVKDLLEELDNNCQLAMQILDEEEQACRQIVEEAPPLKKPALTQAEQNRILKQSFLSLYKKLLAKSQEVDQLQAKYDAQRTENAKLREMNRMLLQGEYAQDVLQDLTPIC